jgi:hypothetical protein
VGCTIGLREIPAQRKPVITGGGGGGGDDYDDNNNCLDQRNFVYNF